MEPTTKSGSIPTPEPGPIEQKFTRTIESILRLLRPWPRAMQVKIVNIVWQALGVDKP